MKSRIWLTLLSVAAAAAQTAPPVPGNGNVTLPIDEYNRLTDLASKPQSKNEAPPFAFTVQSADLHLRVDGRCVTGTIELNGETLAPGALKVPLVSGMTVLDAQQKGKPLPIWLEGGVHHALLEGPGPFAIALETGLPLTVEAGRATFQLPTPAAGTARLTLAVPGEETQVHLSPGLITGRTSRDGQTIIEATLTPGKASSIWWGERIVSPPPAAPKEARFISDVKTLVSVSEAEIRVAALAEINVIQGAPSQFEMQVPEGYELSGATGLTLLRTEARGSNIVMTVTPQMHVHQLLITMTRTSGGAKTEIPLPGFAGAQRETGEVLVEGEGTVELAAEGRGGLRRMDLKEASENMLSLARNPVHAAFRYQRKPAEPAMLALTWTRFPDSAVLAAVVQKAEATTLVTSEGRSLTEVKLVVKNQSQTFLKVALPAGATILTSEVAGEKVKPVQGADGMRVPLLRPGFRPTGDYPVSFVFLHGGTPFDKKGAAALTIPKLDVPIALLKWEVFLPERYKVDDFGGDALSERLLPAPGEGVPEAESESLTVVAGEVNIDSLAPGEVGGFVVDPTRAPVARVNIRVEDMGTGTVRTAMTDVAGRWLVRDVPSGQIKVTAEASGFQRVERTLKHDAARGSRFSMTLNVGSSAETVEITASPSQINRESQQVERQARQNAANQAAAASANVSDLQRRVVGVLPIAVTVPRTGASYRFVRPLVLDEETTVTFRYRSK